MKMIKANKIEKSFGELKVLKGVSLEVDKGEIVTIIGPSGSGKSTLLRCFNQLEKINSGEIEVEGISLTHTTDNERKMALRKMGMVFQNFHLFPHLTVIENIIEAPITVNKTPKDEALELAQDLLNKVGLWEKKDAYPSQLSGGQKQRIAIARALAMKPDIMLFDEPTSALDPELVGEVLKVIKDLAQEHMTMIIVTHEIAFAREISHRIVFMDHGEILEVGKPEEILVNPKHPRIRTFLDKMF